MDTEIDEAKTYELQIDDVEYFNASGIPLLARVYRPLGAGPFPAIVDVHGGAWTSGDRTNNAAIDSFLASAGSVVVALDFRMPPAAGYPAALLDVNVGIRWVKAHARELALRADRIGGFAGSSGAHLLMTNALRPQDPQLTALALQGTDGADASLAFVVLGWPVIDPLSRYRMVKERGNDRLVAAHDAFFGNELAMTESNPQLILDRGEAIALPPMMIIQGTSDDNVPPHMADRFVDTYRERGGSVEIHKFPGETHTFVTKDPNSINSRRALELIKRFMLAGALTV